MAGNSSLYRGIASFGAVSGWILLAFPAFFLFYTTALYWSFRTDINFLLAKQDLIHYWPWMAAFYVHITGGMLSLVTGPVQFIKKSRSRRPAFHRNVGKIYLVAILLLAGPTGLFMAFFANGGFWAGMGFALLSLLWWGSTWLAYQKARTRDFAAHRRWMIRSYAFTFAAVMLRLWVPILSYGISFTPYSLEHQTVVVATAWLSWIPNLAFVEVLLWIQASTVRRSPAAPSIIQNP